MSQLREDLCKRIAERHLQWHKDALALYKMADLPAHQAAQDTFVVLMTEVVHYCRMFDLEPKEIADNLGGALALMHKLEAEE